MSGSLSARQQALRAGDAVTLTHRPARGDVVLEWVGGAEADMVADAAWRWCCRRRARRRRWRQLKRSDGQPRRRAMQMPLPVRAIIIASGMRTRAHAGARA
jgi:hypothetical protein